MIEIFITNLTKYNNGELAGEWVELPMEEEELQEKIKEILDGSEEVFITDFEAPFNIGEYDNIKELNEFSEELENIGADFETIAAIMDTVGIGYFSNLKQGLLEILENYEYTIIHDVSNHKELAMSNDFPEELLPFNFQLVQEAGAENYIDWEGVGRDLDHEGWNIYKYTDSNGIYHSIAIQLHR